jgi:hypothetical protein
MMVLSETQRLILLELAERPRGHFELGGLLGIPPFRIRAELDVMRREQLVTSRHTELGLLWTLADRGWLIFNNENQTELFR